MGVKSEFKIKTLVLFFKVWVKKWIMFSESISYDSKKD